jgi:HD-like signal output (HDOD) protein
MNATEKELFEKAIKEVVDLHGNMAVLSKLDILLKDYNSDLSDAEELIQSDGALSAKIVRISNSVIYRIGDRCGTIRSALYNIGFNEALKLVSLALSKQVFMRNLDAYGISADNYWRYSYFTAVFMEGQAKRFGFEANNAYLIGLLHSIGRVVINELLHKREIEIYWDRFIPPDVWEKESIGFSSEVAGSLLLKNWDFSLEMYQRVENQRKPSKIDSDPLLLLLDYARLVSINLEDSEALASLCEKGAHPYLIKQPQSSGELLSAIAETADYVADIYKSLKDC